MAKSLADLAMRDNLPPVHPAHHLRARGRGIDSDLRIGHLAHHVTVASAPFGDLAEAPHPMPCTPLATLIARTPYKEGTGLEVV